MGKSIPLVRTQEEAINWVLRAVEDAESLRLQCDFAIRVKEQRERYIAWMIARGKALGALYALRATQHIGDVAYLDLHARVEATKTPTVREGVLPFR